MLNDFSLTRPHIPTLLLFSIGVLAIVSACETDSAGTTTPAGDYLDPSTATLEEILERTRAAMGEITSYQTRGTLVADGLTDDDGGSGEYFTAWQSPDNFMFRIEGHDPDSGELQVMEFRNIGLRSFARNSGEDWQEMQPRPEPLREQVLPGHLRLLDMDSVKLIANDAISESGTRLHRLEVIETLESSPESSMVVTTTLLIDANTYLFVTAISDQMLTFILHSRVNGVESEVPSFGHSVYTSEYHDYNKPVEIEIPENFTPPRTIANPSATFKPDPTPTPTPPTLEEIVIRTRKAMGAVTSYETSGKISIERSIPKAFTSFRSGEYSTKWELPGTLWVLEITKPRGGTKNIRFERINNLGLVLINRLGDGWRAHPSHRINEITDRAIPDFFRLLDSAEIVLLDAGEPGTHDRAFYTLKIKDSFSVGTVASGSSFYYVSKSNVESTILVDKETFLFESLTEDIHSVVDLREQRDGEIVAENWTTDVLTTYDFSNYNQPLGIEIPSHYKRWDE